MTERKHQAWNFWSAFVFFGLVVLMGYLLEKKGIDIKEMSLKEAVVIILASYRMTRILVFEKIFKYFRDMLKRREDLYLVGTINSIITCPWCAGVWVTLTIVIFYYLVPYGVLLVYVLALSGVASIVILFSNVLHMWTEGKQHIHRKSKGSLNG
ncbi:MAG: DUF1360 domain-containing protein [Bacteroidales bacterium]|nr:DUF1360 domain-containing protein [Bacteroidales bacterium]